MTPGVQRVHVEMLGEGIHLPLEVVAVLAIAVQQDEGLALAALDIEMLDIQVAAPSSQVHPFHASCHRHGVVSSTGMTSALRQIVHTKFPDITTALFGDNKGVRSPNMVENQVELFPRYRFIFFKFASFH